MAGGRLFVTCVAVFVLVISVGPNPTTARSEPGEFRRLIDVMVKRAEEQSPAGQVPTRILRESLLKRYADTGSQLLWEEYKQNVEWAWANNDPHRMAAVLDHYQSRKNTAVHKALRGWVYEELDRPKQAIQSFSDVTGPFSEGEKKTLQKYRLLPLIYMSGETFHRFYQSDPAARVQLVDPFENRYARYHKGRYQWENEQYRKAYSTLRGLEDQFSPGEVLWDELHLYQVSSLGRSGQPQKALDDLKSYRRGPNFFDKPRSKQGFIEVEGTFTAGSPFGEYLDAWQKALGINRVDWWYETIGEASEPIRYLRIYSSLYEGSPMARLVTTAMRSVTNSQLAVINHKGIRGSFEPGPITRNELFLALPWDNQVNQVSVEPKPSIPGDELSRSVYRLFPDAPFQYIYPDPVTVSGLRRDPVKSRKQTLVISNFLMNRIGGFETVESLERTDRELLEEYLKEGSPVSVD